MASFFKQKATATDKKRSKAIEGGITKDEKQGKQILSLLLLGTGESGKTTVFKQIRMSKGDGYTSEYYDSIKPKLCTNILEPTCNVLEGMAKNDSFKVQDDTFEKAASKVLNAKKLFAPAPVAFEEEVISVEDIEEEKEHDCFDKETYVALKTIWQNDSFQGALQHYSADGMFNIPDSFPKLYAKLVEKYPKWGGPGWKPGEEDMLLVRVRTTGFNDQRFIYNKVNFRIVDVGGQRSERKKWIHMFQGVHCIIFVVGTSEYDQTLYEDGKTNRMEESMNFFDETCKNPHFENSAMVLFLNKVDLFDQKFRQKKIPLNVSGLFPDAPKANKTPQDVEDAIRYIEKKYTEKLDPRRGRGLVVHPTCAIDNKKMDVVMRAVAEMLVVKNLRTAGILAG